jgi:hypothetical protein
MSRKAFARRTQSHLLGYAVLLAICAGAGCARQQAFNTPEEAAEALITAAEKFDVDALKRVLGPQGVDLVVTADRVQDKNQSQAFAAEARMRAQVRRDPNNAKVAALFVGPDDWPLPIPIVESGGKWRLDTAEGRDDILVRRIGMNELDAIEVCRGYVEAQQEYASEKRDGATVNQYAQRIISSPGKQDGLAWQAADGTWQGPVGEGIAKFIAEGHKDRYEPYHGYYFKILKSQGPAAPLGAMNFLVKDAMIGGFALVAAPADYDVTGVMTFIVSHDGVVYQKDLGPQSVEQFHAMEAYNPDSSWKPVEGS